MTYDVSVKILSFQLLSMAVVVLAPQAKPLANLLVLQRPSPPATQPALFTAPRTTKTATLVQIGLAAWVLAGALLLSGLDWHETGGGRPRPALYGIWTVETFTRNGATVPPLTTQPHRWRRLIIDNPDTLSYQQMDDTLITSPAVLETHTITLTGATPPATLTIDRPAPDRLTLSGHLDGQPVTMTLRRLNPNQMPLRRNTFHWTQQYPDIPPEQ